VLVQPVNADPKIKKYCHTKDVHPRKIREILPLLIIIEIEMVCVNQDAKDDQHQVL
jgi:hypothetical protein